jgi:methanogenic corrinoid protein MtbC1
MNTLIDYSDEPKYTIKTVCAQTGIRAVTLRAWERRHEILTPYRSENRYRLYSERDVAILRWIKNRVDSGIAISSAISELRSLMRSGMTPEAIPIGPSTTPHRHSIPPEQFSRQLYQALVAHDEGRAGDIFHEIQSAFDLSTICQDVITPCLVELGDAWYRGSIRITTEHFASGYVRGKLLSMFQSYPSRRSAPYILIGCAPSEQHEIGALMVAVLLRSNGFRIEYLGPDIPLDDLVDYAAFEHPDMIILSASLESSALELARMQEKLAKVRPTPLFGFGGQAFVAKPELKKQVRGSYLGDTLLSAITVVRSLLPKERSVKKAEKA